MNPSVNFELVSGAFRNEDVGPFLKRSVPSFVSSDAYLLHDGELDDLSTIMLSAFAKYLAQLCQHDPSSSSIDDGLHAICDLLAINNPGLSEAVEDGFFAPTKDDPAALEALFPRMAPALQAAFLRWSEQENGG